MGRRIERAALVALIVFTLMAIVGFATFGTHPQWMRVSPTAPAIYGLAFVWFARGQVLLAAAALGVVLIRRAGARWIGAFAAIYVVSLSSELAGTTLGLPFGPYAYTDGLGPKWFGHVPLVIPLSWFVMAVPSYAIARALVRQWRHLRGDVYSNLARIAIGSLVLLSWDLALDPAMSHATKYWVWGNVQHPVVNAPYYGMPWSNLFGWYVTGLALMAILFALRADKWMAELPVRWLSWFYVVNLALSLGICAAAHLNGALVASVIPLALCAIALHGDRTGESPEHKSLDAGTASRRSDAEPA